MKQLLAYDPGLILENLLRACGYRGALPRLWLRLIAILLTAVIILGLGAGIAVAAQNAIQAVTPNAQPAAVEPFSLSGNIQQISPAEWIIEGVAIAIDPQTTIEGAAIIGESATAQGIILEDGTLLARSITVTNTILPTAMATPVPTSIPAAVVATDSVPTPTLLPPTSIPIPTEPVPVPAQTDDPFMLLLILIDTGMSDGRISSEVGIVLLEHVAKAQKAVTDGKANQLRNQLRELQRTINTGTNNGSIDVTISQEILNTIIVIANTYSIELSSPDQQNDDDDDEDNDDDD
jgi:hypothetical protein